MCGLTPDGRRMCDDAATAAILAHLEHGPATAVDMLLSRVLGRAAAGTLYYLPHLRRMADVGLIERAAPPDLYEQHVRDFPGAHLASSLPCVEQAVPWRICRQGLTPAGRSGIVTV